MLQLPASVSGFEDLHGIEAPLYLGIGVFDGLHRGHKAVVESAVSAANAAGGVSGVLTFDPHPSRLFRPETATRLILPISRKVELLHGIGVQVVIGKQFDTNFAAIEAGDFAAFLKRELPSLKSISVGSNFRFGSKRAGNAALLQKCGAEQGLEVAVVERLQHEGEPISSTRIRKALEAGAIVSVNALLGYRYGFRATIVRGARKGREFGFPTLNLPWVPECLPRFGVYRVRLRAAGASDWLAGIANYGVKPTVEREAQPAMEVHVLEGTQLDAGDAIEVEWLEFLRGEQKFETEAILRAQIAKDVAWARARMSDG